MVTKLLSWELHKCFCEGWISMRSRFLTDFYFSTSIFGTKPYQEFWWEQIILKVQSKFFAWSLSFKLIPKSVMTNLHFKSMFTYILLFKQLKWDLMCISYKSHLMSKIKWFLVCSQNYANVITINYRIFSAPKKETSH